MYPLPSNQPFAFALLFLLLFFPRYVSSGGILALRGFPIDSRSIVTGFGAHFPSEEERCTLGAYFAGFFFFPKHPHMMGGVVTVVSSEFRKVWELGTGQASPVQ
jgi:hypothetical protein